MKSSTDYDSPWKEVIERYFSEFIAFFFPKAYDDIDWAKGYIFLDKELRQITRDAKSGRKYVDKLVQVWLKNGDDVWAVIHADVQVRREKKFSERMYMYNYRLFDRYRRHAASFAVLGYVPGKEESHTFRQELWDCEVMFRFPVVSLADYADDRKSLEQSGNPFAVVVMAHLAKKTAGYPGKLRHEKITIIRHLYRKGFSKQDIINLFRFVDWLMNLPETQERLFWQELSVLEKEGTMPYITSVERIGFDRGIREGWKQLFIRQIEARFSKVPQWAKKKIESADMAMIEKWGIRLLKADSLKSVLNETDGV